KETEEGCLQATGQFIVSSLSTILQGNCGAVITLSCELPVAVVKGLDVSFLHVSFKNPSYIMWNIDMENLLSFRRYFSSECTYVIISCALNPLGRSAPDGDTWRGMIPSLGVPYLYTVH